MRLYPALLLLYGGGIATIAAKNYAMLKTLFLDAKVRVPKGEKPLVSCIYPWTVLGTNFAKELPGMRDRSTPLSDRLFEVLRQPLKEYLPDDFDYQQCFDKFEYLLALVLADIKKGGGFFIGQFGWRISYPEESGIINKISLEIGNYQESYAPLEYFILFGSNLERLKRAKDNVDSAVTRRGWLSE